MKVTFVISKGSSYRKSDYTDFISEPLQSLPSVSGYRREDGLDVCIKQVPRTRIANYTELNGRKVPLEFAMHIRAASQSRGVVKV